MKRAIEKAISGGWKFPQTTIGNVGTWHNTSKGFRPWIDGVSVYELIFGTNLVECLVGEGSCCGWCGATLSEITAMGWSYCACNRPDRVKTMLIASYHRSIMANLPDIEALKQYLIKLAGDAP